MQCNQCGHKNHKESSFCVKCGQKLEKFDVKEKEEIKQIKNKKAKGKKKKIFAFSFLVLLILLAGILFHFHQKSSTAAQEEARKMVEILRSPEDPLHEDLVKELSLDKVINKKDLLRVLESAELTSGSRGRHAEIAFSIEQYDDIPQEKVEELQNEAQAFTDLEKVQESIREDVLNTKEIILPLDYSFWEPGQRIEAENKASEIVEEMNQIAVKREVFFEPIKGKIEQLTEESLLKSLGVKSEDEFNESRWIKEDNPKDWALLARTKTDEKHKILLSDKEGVQRLFPTEEQEQFGYLQTYEMELYDLPDEDGVLIRIHFDYGTSASGQSCLFQYREGKINSLGTYYFRTLTSLNERDFFVSGSSYTMKIPHRDAVDSNLNNDYSVGEQPAILEKGVLSKETRGVLRWEKGGIHKVQGRRITSEYFRSLEGGAYVLDAIHKLGNAAYAIYEFPNGIYHVNTYSSLENNRDDLYLHLLNFRKEGNQLVGFTERKGKIEDYELTANLAFNEDYANATNGSFAGSSYDVVDFPISSLAPEESMEIKYTTEDLDGIRKLGRYIVKDHTASITFAYSVFLMGMEYNFSDNIQLTEEYKDTQDRCKALGRQYFYMITTDDAITGWYALHGSLLTKDDIRKASDVVVQNRHLLTRDHLSVEPSSFKSIFLQEEGLLIGLLPATDFGIENMLHPDLWERDGDSIYVGSFSYSLGMMYPEGYSLITGQINDGPQGGEINYPYRFLEIKNIWGFGASYKVPTTK